MTNEQYFEPKPSSVSDPIAIRVALPDGPLRLTTDRGVFSHGALDTGVPVGLRLDAHGTDAGNPR